jgi:hypothetical protein
MKRLNHKTGKPFERGELRHDGKKFSSYRTRTHKKTGYCVENWVDAANSNLLALLADCRKTAREKNLPFDLDKEYLKSIMVPACPIFGYVFDWDRMGMGQDPKAPSLDKFFPHLGYVKGNVAFISLRANMIKSDATEVEMYAVADWFYDEKKKRLNANKKSTTPVPTGTNQQSQDESQPGTIPAAGTGEDHHDLDHYQRTVRGEDADYRTQTRGGDGVGYGVQKVGTSEVFTRVEDNGQPDAEIIRLDFGSGHLPDKP